MLCAAMYSGDRRPYSPVDFLYSWWCQADKLAEYQQQVGMKSDKTFSPTQRLVYTTYLEHDVA
jgi:hypothetical protein